MNTTRASRRRVGITPVISTILLMGLAIVAVGVAWGSVNTQAGRSELAYANGVGLSDQVILTLTVTSSSIGTCDCKITVKLDSTQTVAKVKAGTFELVHIDNTFTLNGVA